MSLRNPTRSYRVRESSDWQDVLIDVFGGMLFSLNRKTITIEECDEAYVVRTPRQIEEEQQQILQASLDLFLRENAPPNESGVVVILTSGEIRIGQIEEVTVKEIVLGVKRKAEESKPADRVVLREGGVLVGDIVRQNVNTITLRTDRGVQEIDKRRILLILYHRERQTEPALNRKKGQEGAQKEVVTYIESVHIPRADIARIVLKGQAKDVRNETEPSRPSKDAGADGHGKETE